MLWFLMSCCMKILWNWWYEGCWFRRRRRMVFSGATRRSVWRAIRGCMKCLRWLRMIWLNIWSIIWNCFMCIVKGIYVGLLLWRWEVWRILWRFAFGLRIELRRRRRSKGWEICILILCVCIEKSIMRLLMLSWRKFLMLGVWWGCWCVIWVRRFRKSKSWDSICRRICLSWWVWVIKVWKEVSDVCGFMVKVKILSILMWYLILFCLFLWFMSVSRTRRRRLWRRRIACWNWAVCLWWWIIICRVW